MTNAIPPLPGEDHLCPECGFSYLAADPADCVRAARALAGRLRALLDRTLSDPGEGWSATEYLYHLRDVLITSTIRLHRVRTEERPALEPMLNDLRARRFGYRLAPAGPAVEEIARLADGFAAEVGRNSDETWERTATRLLGEERTARWIVRNAGHEIAHHVHDLEKLLPR